MLPSRAVSFGRGVQMLLVTIAVAAATYAQAAVSPLQEMVRVALRLSDNQMAILQGPALSFPMVLAAVPLGLLVDRYSRVRLLFVLMVLDIAGSALTAAASHFSILLLARGLVGLMSLAAIPVAFSLVSDLYAPAERGRATMAIQIGQCGGMASAFALGGAMLAAAGSEANSWRWAMSWLIAPLVLVIFSMLLMREPERGNVAIQGPSGGGTWLQFWNYRAIIAVLVAAVVMGQIALYAVYVWAAPMLSRNFGLPPQRIGAIMGLGLLVSGVVGSIGGGILADLCQRIGGPRRTAVVLSALSLLSAPFGFFILAPGAASASALLFIFITIVTALSVMGTTLFIVVIPNELSGLSMAVLVAVSVLVGVGLAPVSVSLLSTVIGGPALIGKALSLICVATSIAGAASFALARFYVPHSGARDALARSAQAACATRSAARGGGDG